ncbi:MAG TPA: hypothetical protein VN829_13085, partial [Dongiaceae bacterium]|nr:hypothetical protein [Dongiaceae bacterium]
MSINVFISHVIRRSDPGLRLLPREKALSRRLFPSKVSANNPFFAKDRHLHGRQRPIWREISISGEAAQKSPGIFCPPPRY